MKIWIAILLIIVAFIGGIFISKAFYQPITNSNPDYSNSPTETTTEYICSSNGLKVTSALDCPNDKVSNVIMFKLSMDALGTDKFETSGTGWLSNQQCINALKNKGYSNYNYCYISDIQILTGSDPNPLKMKSAGYSGSDIILFGGEIFRVSCTCSDKEQFITDSEHYKGNLGSL